MFSYASVMEPGATGTLFYSIDYFSGFSVSVNVRTIKLLNTIFTVTVFAQVKDL